MRQNVLRTIGMCVQSSTRDAYKIGWRRFEQFCQWLDVDPYLTTVPHDWVVPPGEIPVSYKDFVVVAFMQKLCIEEGLCPGTVSVYLSGVRFVFKLFNKDIEFLGSPWISSSRTAINLIYRRDHPIAGSKALPFTCDMVMHADLVAFKSKSCPKDQVINVSLKLAMTCLLRVSEYLPGAPHVDHWMRSDDVVFRLASGQVVPSWGIHYYAWDLVCSVIITVRSAKNDVDGEGHRFEFLVAEVSPTRAFDIVRELYNWAVVAKPALGQPFLSYQGRWTLSYAVLTKAVKLVAQQMGLDQSRYRTHSLRIGGASMLAAALVPDYLIQKLGRWKSLAFLDYIRLARGAFDAALAAISNPTLLTVRDVRVTNPGA